MKVLKGHRKLGKRFIPPFLLLPNIREVKWVDEILPEILWLGLLNSYYDLKEGARLSLSLAKAANNVYLAKDARLFGAISSYSLLDQEQCAEVIDILYKSNQLRELQKALYALFFFYPECPLNFLFQKKLFKSASKDSGLRRFKKMLSSFFDREGIPATFMQASAIYIAFCTEVFVAPSGTALSRFPNIIDYPKTDESTLIASSIRASLNGFFGVSTPDFKLIPHTSWPVYFWNRGLVIEPCLLD